MGRALSSLGAPRTAPGGRRATAYARPRRGAPASLLRKLRAGVPRPPPREPPHVERPGGPRSSVGRARRAAGRRGGKNRHAVDRIDPYPQNVGGGGEVTSARGSHDFLLRGRKIRRPRPEVADRRVSAGCSGPCVVAPQPIWAARRVQQCAHCPHFRRSRTASFTWSWCGPCSHRSRMSLGLPSGDMTVSVLAVIPAVSGGVP